MKAESNLKPNKFTIENKSNNKCDIIFCDNVKEITENEEIKYTYDMYRITINARANLEQLLQNEIEYKKWLELSKEQEYTSLAKEIRAKRDKLLAETDWTQVTDTALTKEKQEKYKEYRQKLRDITKHEEFPYNVDFPSIPNE